MKTVGAILALFALCVCAIPILRAEPQREQLAQMVQQLQANPSDNALRERIIKLAVAIRPSPAIPEEARENFVRGNTAVQNATGPADYDRAIGLYANAIRLAPWWGDAYYNQAKAYELRKRYAEAIDSLGWYLKASPGAPDVRAAQDKIYELKEKQANYASSPEAAKARELAIIDSLNGARFSYVRINSFNRLKLIYDVRGRQIVGGMINQQNYRNVDDPLPVGVYFERETVTLDGLRFVVPDRVRCGPRPGSGACPGSGVISADGRTLTWTDPDRGEYERYRSADDPKVMVYTREN